MTTPSPGSATSAPGALTLVFVSLGLAMIAVIFLLAIAGKRQGSAAPSLATATPGGKKVDGRSSALTWPRARGEDESTLPSWLRPSVRAARFWTPRGAAPTDEASSRSTVTFREPAAESVSRMEVRHDEVRLLDQRNETYASILARLGSGDEVDVHKVEDAWALVETPHGLTGWLPAVDLTKATARRAVVDAADAAAVDAARAAAARPAGRRRFPLGRRLARAAIQDPQLSAETRSDRRSPSDSAA